MYTRISFTCDDCGTDLHREVHVPDTNMEDNEGEYSEESISCNVCKKLFNGHVNNRGGIAFITIENIGDVDTSDLYIEPEEPYNFNDPETDIGWHLHISQKTVYEYFTISTQKTRGMLTIKLSDRDQSEMLNRMILVQTISALEAYLSDTLISRTISDPFLLSRLFDRDRNLKKEQYSIIEYLNDNKLPIKRANSYLSNISYHNLPRVEALYKDVLEINFNYGKKSEKQALLQAIESRHDFVHRNGKTKKDGDLRPTNKTYIAMVIDLVEKLVDNIEQDLNSIDDIPF